MAKLERTFPLKANGIPVFEGTIQRDEETRELKLFIFGKEVDIPAGNLRIIWDYTYGLQTTTRKEN